MNGSRATALTLLAGLWSGLCVASPSTLTVGDLAARAEDPVVGDAQVAVDPARARQHYARYLADPNGLDPRMRATAIRRLADLTLEEAETINAELGVDGRVPALVNEAIGLYRDFLGQFPADENAPLVQYQLARALDFAGRNAESLAALETLGDSGLEGPLVAEAHFRRAEMLFSARHWGRAEAAYRAVLAEPDSAFHEQARYKLGWSLFKQARYEEGLDSFLAVLDRRLSQPGVGDPMVAMNQPTRELVEDTLRVTCISLSYLAGHESLANALAQRSIEAPYEALLYEQLGQLYLDQERYQDAAASLAGYVAAHPGDRRSPAFQLRVAQAYEAGGFHEQVLAAKREYVDRFGINSGFWDGRSGDALPEARAALRETLDELAEYYHAAAREQSSPEAAVEAVHWYRTWLASFPADPEAPHRQFLLAELLYDSGRTEEAAVAYEKAAYDYPPHAEAAEAGHAAVLAWREVVAGGTESVDERSIRSALRFADGFPDHSEALAARTEASRGLFRAGRLQEAFDQAERVLAVPDPGRKLQASALLVAGHAAFDLGDYASAEDAYRTMLETGLGGADSTELAERLAAAIYRQGEAASAAGDVSRAVAHFSRVAAVAPGDPIAATADYDAVAILVGATRWDEAIPRLRAFRQRYPDHALQDQVTLNLATALGESGDTLGAADELMRVSALVSQPADVRRAALWESATSYTDREALPRAAHAWSSYVAQYPEPLDPAMEARLALTRIYKQLGDPVERHSWLEATIAADQAAAARTQRSRTIAAQAAIELADDKRIGYEALDLSAPLDRSVPLKKSTMEAALDAYARAADYGLVEVTTQATYRIAEIYREFGSALVASERPGDLDAEAMDQYEILLEEKAFPFEEQAIRIHQSNAERAITGVYDRWVVQSFEALADLVPARYARNEMGEGFVRRVY